MQKQFIYFALLIVAVHSLCNSTTFMNPLNNACVNQCPWELTKIYYADSSTRTCVTVCPSTPSLYANDNLQSCVQTCPWDATNTSLQSHYDNYYRRCVMNCPSSPSYYAFSNSSTNGICVQYCPGNTFSLDSNRTCVITCPVLYFVNYTLNLIVNQCVARCPSNTYKNSTMYCVNATNCPANEYGDPITGQCTATCTYTSSIRTYADRNANVKLCVYVCPPNFYQKDIAGSNICINVAECLSINYFVDHFTYACVLRCPNGSYSYTNGSCVTSCPSSFYADPLQNQCQAASCTAGRFRDGTSNFCVVQCPPGYFGDVNANYICRLVCSISTEYGNPVTRLCVNKTDCTSPYIYADDFTRQCVIRCPESQNTFGSPTANYCNTTCPYSASLYSFKDSSTQTCVTGCPLNPLSYADIDSKSCLQVCPINYYAVDSDRTCQTSCPNNFYKNNLTRQCVSTCPIDPVVTYFHALNTNTSQCLQYCPTGFLANPVTLTCINTMCPDNPSLFGYNQTCIPICPEGTFSNSDSRTCEINCTGIYFTDNSTRRCVKICPDNPSHFADWTTNTCVATCPPTYFADSSIRQCVTTCNQSNLLLAYTPLRLCVLTCLNNTYSHLGVCIATCPNTTAPYYYIDATTRSCVAVCPDYYFRDNSLGKCVTLGGCSNSYYADYSSRDCVQFCNSSIFTYMDTVTMSCVSHCPYGLFGDFSVTAEKKCAVECPPAWYADNSTWTCVQICPANPSYYADLTTRVCVSHCRVELDLFAYDGNRTCVNPCPANTSADIYTRRCLDSCLLFPSTYLYVNGTERVCVLQCPIGYFADNSTRNCVTGCPQIQNYFADWFSRTCVSLCPWTSTTNYYADNSTRTCVMDCPNATVGNQTFRDKTIRICMPVCTGNQFSDNSTGDCVQVCPTTPDYFGQMETKTCVLDCNRTIDTYAQNITRICVKVCPAGSYADNFTQRCVAICPVAQLYYGDNSTHRCVLTCPSFPSLFANNLTQTCVSTCPGFTYGAPTSRVCQNPLNCSNGYFADNFTKLCVTNCPATQASYAQNTTKRCVRICPVGSFADNATYRCVGQCPSTPAYFGYLEKCLVSCPVNTYADTPTRLCVASLNCTNNTWGDPTSQKCVDSCPFNYFADRRTAFKICVQLCPSGFYADDLTKDCVDKCPQSNKTYGANSTRRCVQVCPINEFAQNITRMCMSNCPNSSFADANVRVCVAVCSATPNLYGNPVDNTCVYTCPSNPDLYAQNSSRLCLSECPFNQSTFADRLTRRCVLTCPVSGFTYADNHTRRCQVNCTYNTSISILTYADNSTLTCVVLCPSNPQYYADISTGTGLCVPFCPNSTLPRIFSDNSTRICQPLCNVSLDFYSTNDTGDCVLKCSGGSFADNQTQSCVPRCPGRITVISRIVDTFGYEFNRTCVDFCVSPFFSQNSTRLCVLYCPQLQYTDTLLRRCVSNCDGQRGEYADNSTNRCVTVCPTLPDTFADSTTYTCVTPCPLTPTINYNCVNACPPSTFADNMTRQCKSICLQNTSLLAQFADNYTGRCVRYCPRNLFTYADTVTFSCVIQCPDNQTIDTIFYNRTFADDSTKTCVWQCPTNPWTFADNTTRKCVFKCPTNNNDSYAQNNTRQCVTNCTYWGTYAQNTTTFCVSVCPQNSFADKSNMRCVQKCPPGTFADNSTWKCVTGCPANPALYGDTTTRVCVINCPNSLYGDDSSRMCKTTCPETPAIYFAYQPTRKCYLNCLFPYFGQANNATPTYRTCQTYCYMGQYKNLTLHRCQKCKDQCTTCVSFLGCQSCIQNYYLYNGTCLTGCASGTGSSCRSACPFNNITNTITFADIKSLSCVEICPITSTGGSFGLNQTLFCVQSCPITYYNSNITRRCQLCVAGCNNCTSPQVCFSCYPGYIFSKSLCVRECSESLRFFFGTTCLSSCIQGTYLMTDQITCGSCSSICATCSLIASNCTKCVGAYLFNYNCVTKCPTNYYPDANLSCQVCTSTVTACNISPLTYTLVSFSKNGQLFAILQFNRPTYIDTSIIKQIVNISIPGLSPSQYSWTAAQINETSYKITIASLVSLNQLSLTLTFINPALVIDSQGGSITSTSTVSPLPTFDYISPQTKKASKTTQNFSSAISWLAIAIMVILIFKGSYTLLIACQVFQMIFFHYFVYFELPYNFSNFLIQLQALDFLFLPNLLKQLVPTDFVTPKMPVYWTQIIPDTVFFLSSGHYLIIIICYASWAILISLLKNKTINKFNKLRRFAKGVYNRRVRYGVIHECIWFCYISFVFFGLWQLRDLVISGTWSYGNILFALFGWISCLFLTFWVLYLAIRYKDKMEKLPKKFSFILGQDSHLPFEMPLRHIRKFLFCTFLAIGAIQATLITIIGVNFMVLSFYLFFKPAKSRFSNWINILIELSYIGLQITLLLYVNEIKPTTQLKLQYGIAMIALSITALLLLVIWLIWQFLLFLYDFKFVRDIIEETKLANQIHPEEDNLKVQLDKEYGRQQIVQQSISDGASQDQHQQETIQGIQKQYNNEVVHYIEEKKLQNNTKQSKPANRMKSNERDIEQSDSNQPRLISSRASSRMLFADLNIEDIE